MYNNGRREKRICKIPFERTCVPVLHIQDAVISDIQIKRANYYKMELYYPL